jgi:hypothetical protein
MAYNAAHEVPNTPTRGYHETMTQAWMRLVYRALEQSGPAGTADRFLDDHPELSHMKTLQLFYSRERLMSPDAKARFVEPDISPLPVPIPRRSCDRL